MSQSIETQSALLDKLKRERPFKPFEIKTKEGHSFKVNEPFEFGFNDLFVVVVNEKGSPVHLDYDAIDAIQVNGIAK